MFYKRLNGKVSEDATIPTGYDNMTQSYDYFEVEKKGLWGVCDNKGNEIIKCVYDMVQVLPNNKIRVIRNKDKQSALFDENGNILVGWIDGYVDPFKNGLEYSHLTVNNLSGVMDMDFNIIVEPKYSWIRIINNKYFEVTLRNGDAYYPVYKGVIDNKGDTVVPIEIYDESNGIRIEYDENKRCLYYYFNGERYIIYNE